VNRGKEGNQRSSHPASVSHERRYIGRAECNDIELYRGVRKKRKEREGGRKRREGKRKTS